MPERLERSREIVSIWEDLKRRNVYRVGVGYVALVWLLIQASEIIFPRIGFSDWAITMVIVISLLGFPVALFLGWTFEITPKGIVYDRPRGIRWSTYLVIDLLIVAALIAAGSIYWFRIHQVAPQDSAQFANSIAVLRFINIGEDKEGDYLGDGLTEELIHELTNLKTLKVTARTSIWSLPRSDQSVTDIASRLKVNKLLEGSVRSDGDLIRVTAQLIGGDGYHLWSRAYERKTKDLLGIQKDIAAQVVDELDLLLSDEVQDRLASQPTSNTEAYDLYLRGRQQLRMPNDGTRISKAKAYFLESTNQDRRFSLAYAGVCESELAFYRLTRDTTNFEEAELACHRALTLDEGLAAVYIALGNLYRHAGLNDKAESEYRMALAINAGLEGANYGLGRTYQAQGRLEAAEETLLKSIEMEPGYYGPYLGFGNFLHRQGRYDEAVSYYEEVIQLAPDYVAGYVNLGSALHWLGDWSGAEAAWRKSLELKPAPMAYQNMGTLYYYQHRFPEAAQMHQQATEISPADHRAWGRLADTQRFIPGQETACRETYARAIRLVESQLSVNPNEPEDLAYLGVYQANLGNLDSARTAVNRAIELAPKNPNTYYAKAIVDLSSGHPAEAIAGLQRAVGSGYSVKLLEQDPELTKLSKRIDFLALLSNGATAHLDSVQ